MSYSATATITALDGKPNIYLGANTDEQYLKFTLINTGDPVTLAAVTNPISNANPTGGWDFQVTLDGDILTSVTPTADRPLPAGWSLYSLVDDDTGDVTAYLINVSGKPLAKDDELEFHLKYSTVSAPGATTSVKPCVAANSTIAAKLASHQERGTTVNPITQPDTLNVLLSGLEQLPLAVEFVGNRTLINDGSSQTLTFQLINTSDEDSIFLDPAETKFRVWFDLDKNTPSPWALGKKSIITDGTTLAVGINPVDISGSTSTAWTVTPPAADASDLIWTIAPATATTSITPYAHDATDPSTARPSFRITGLNTTAVPGWTNMYIQYEDILGYSDAVLVARIEKSGMIAGQIPGQSLFVTGTEKSPNLVAICSSSTSYPTAGAGLDVQPNLILHNPDATDNNGSLLAFSSQETKAGHSVAVAGIATEFSDRGKLGLGLSGDLVFYTVDQKTADQKQEGWLLERMRIAKDGATTFQGAVTANSSLTVAGATTLNDSLTITTDDWGAGKTASITLGDAGAVFSNVFGTGLHFNNDFTVAKSITANSINIGKWTIVAQGDNLHFQGPGQMYNNGVDGTGTSSQFLSSGVGVQIEYDGNSDVALHSDGTSNDVTTDTTDKKSGSFSWSLNVK